MKRIQPEQALRSPAARIASGLLALLFAGACGGAPAGPPDVVLDRSVCDGCGMLISDPAYAAAYRAGRRTAVFDDIGCLLRDLDSAGLSTEPSEAATVQVWFLDHDQRWIPGPEAVFVRSPELETPMGGHVQAFADRAEAERAAAAVGGTVVGSFTELRAGAGAQTRSEGGDDDSSS